jgi:hypothetical protein
MYPCTAIYAWPTSPQRRELGLNTTRIANVDATKTEELSQALTTLTEQVQTCIRFVQGNVLGFENAYLSGIAPRVGIRETRRIIGEYVLTGEDVMQGRKFENGIAKGGHHVDIHGSGTDQVRVPVKDGGSYDIPYGTLIPKGLENVLVGGRCFSSDREAHGSARVMGQTMAMGQAAGTAAAMCVACNWPDVRDVPVEGLRETLEQQGAVLKGTH